MLTPGQAHDLACAEPLIDSVDPQALIGDKALTLAATFGLYQRSAGLEGRFDVFVSGRKTPVSGNEARQVAPAAEALGRSHLQTPAGSTLRLLAG